jgi:hypothetical protein
MKRKLIWVPLVIFHAFFLASCAVPYSLVTEAHVTAPENFSVDLPQGWRQHNTSGDPLYAYTAMLEKRRKLGWDVIRLTRDGLLLQQIGIGRIPISEELPYTKKKLAQEMIPQEAAELIGAAFLGGLEDRADRLRHRGGTVAGLLEFTREQLDRRVAEGLADLVNAAAVIVGEARIESALEGAANGLDIARARRGEHALAGDLVDMSLDMGLERPPARKSVVARHCQLRLGELGARLLRPQRLEALLRFVPQMFEIGLRGQRASGTPGCGTRRGSVFRAHD